MQKLKQSSTNTQKLLMTVEEAAQALSVGRTFVYSLLGNKKLLSIKVGRSRRVVISSLHQYISDQLHQS